MEIELLKYSSFTLPSNNTPQRPRKVVFVIVNNTNRISDIQSQLFSILFLTIYCIPPPHLLS